MTAAATLIKFKQRIAGDDPNFSDGWDLVLDDILQQVTDEVNREVASARGIRRPWSFLADSVATERVFSTMPGGTRFVSIDDCIEIERVKLYSPPGTLSQTLTAADWYAGNSMPIVGIYRVNSLWPANALAAVGVVAKWGFAADWPGDITDAVIMEAEREYLAVRAGNDDKVGSHVFGTVVISKAFSAKTERLITTYGYGGAQMRGN